MPGDKGIRGDAGWQGMKGERGLQGYKGDEGHRGDRGKFGKDGEQGAQGDKGEKGAPGYAGMDGLDGEKGGVGEDGYDGIPGPQGKHINIFPIILELSNDIFFVFFRKQVFKDYLVYTIQVLMKLGMKRNGFLCALIMSYIKIIVFLCILCNCIESDQLDHKEKSEI